MEHSYSSYRFLSQDPGVYIFLDEKSSVLYVGKAKNLKKRVSTYFTNKNLGEKTNVLVKKIKLIKTISVESEVESLLLEANLIKKYNPKYNLRLTDGKAYLLARITLKDSSPKVLFARQSDDINSKYFGPFPNSSDLKLVLKLIRPIFPYQSIVNHPKKYCLYYHLGLCPCPPMFKSEAQNQFYRKDILYLIQFLEGNTKKIIKELEIERDKESNLENFEYAKIIQNKIVAIQNITLKRRNPFEYESNPNLKNDIRNDEMTDLISVLKQNSVQIKQLNRIECYDISNISGKFATGSMVVFTNGEKDTKNYRRFKIKRPPKVIPNDFAMIREVITRRLTHPQWDMPDLIIVDGGKGQISSAKKALDEANQAIPLVGIAKREELIITSDFKIISLSKNSIALNLVKRIRDEAHRFAITYHKKLRSKYFLTSLN